MFGFSPAALDQRDEFETEVYETVEGPWLVAWWDYYVAKIEADPRKVFEITKGGVSTGTLFMSEELYDRRCYRVHERVIAKKLADEMAAEIDKDIIAQLIASMHGQHIDTVAPPYNFGRFLPGQPLNSESLSAHQKFLQAYPSRTIAARHLQALGVLV